MKGFTATPPRFFNGEPWGDCIQPTPGTDYVEAVVQEGITYSYERPQITAITPARGVNMANKSFDITIFGTNMGGNARELQRVKCLQPGYRDSRACQLLAINGVIIFNTSCSDVDLMHSGTSLTAIAEQIEARQIALCRDKNEITFKCLYAFTEKAEYTSCVERCRFAFRNCGRRCAEDFIRCQVLPFGGQQHLTVVVGGLHSNSLNLTYNPPRVWYVIPPELEAVRLMPGGALSGQEPKLLTLIGRNFGVDLALAYAGRRQLSPIGPYKWDFPNLLYDDKVIPTNVESIAWWDMAQYRTCFSSVDTATPAPEGTPEELVSSFRTCDAGVSISEMINLANMDMRFVGEDTPRDLQRMIVKAPEVPLPPSKVEAAITVMVESLGQRSFVSPSVNSSVTFRQKCSDFAPNMGRLTLPFRMATKKIRGIGSRSEVQMVSWPSYEMMLMFGGTTIDQSQSRNIWTSSFSGINGWKEMLYDDAVPWFSTRSNCTVVIFKDILTVMAGWSEGPIPRGSQFPTTIYHNDVWVYADTEGVANYYKREDTPTPELFRGQGFVPYWIRVLEHAPWLPRSSMSAVVFKGRLYLMGGIGSTVNGDGPIADLWVTSDMVEWELLQDLGTWYLTTPMWQGRNSVWAMVLGDAMYVVARVENSFYNTFYTTNGVDWQEVPGACGLSDVEVQAAVTYRGVMMLFTVGCHDYDLPTGAPRYERAVPCSPTQDGPYQRENRVYYSSTGVTWRLSQRPYRLNPFLIPQFIQHPWSGSLQGEYRYGYRVLVHMDSLYIVGGNQMTVYRASIGGDPVLDRNGKRQYQGIPVMDIWISKGMVDMSLLCTETSDLTTKDFKDRMQMDRLPECTFFFDSLPGGILKDAVLE